MKKSRYNLHKILITMILIYLGFLFIGKNTFLYKYEETQSFNKIDIKATNIYSENFNDQHLLKINTDKIEINAIRIGFSNRTTQNSTISIYYKDVDDNLIAITSRPYCFLQKEIVIPIQYNKYSNLYIDIPNTTKINEVGIGLKYFSPVQKSISWILEQFALLILSAILSFLLTRSINSNINSKTITHKEDRNSTIELLRIICMLLLVAHHCVVHGGALNMAEGRNLLFSYLFLPVGKICFIIYIAISMWFFVDQQFSAVRFIKVWFEVFFYSFFFTIIAFMLGANISILDIFSSLLPIIGNSHGFASSYLLFYLLLPFIKKGTDHLTKNQSRYLLFLIFVAQILSQIMGQITNYYQYVFSELTLFIFCYVLMLNLKKWPLAFLKDKRITSGTAFIIWLILLQANYSVLWGRNNKIIDFLLGNSGTESSLLMIIAGFSVFFFVKELPKYVNPKINKLATYSFAVLLIHDHNFLRNIVWSYFVETDTWYYSSYFILILTGIVFIIYFVCSIIELLRKNILEVYILKQKPVLKFVKIIDNYLIFEEHKK